jgi:hypothetical protein
MTDDEIIDEIFERASEADELWYIEQAPPEVLRKGIKEALRTARQPVAHEVPGFHIDSGGGVALWTVEYGSWAAIQPGDFQLFDQRRVVGDGPIPSKWSDIKPEDFRTFDSGGEVVADGKA